ncbi:mechanosensitive ion channel domain-containing protein [Sediminicoccus sp. KRV36]|uniref:mechanosensitive ion channel family protein n=1 Tax=Sediminicoccus sp. KRV36 TaxID=3133721 RepID=UPI00200E6ACA|nr:mechanosensitive ion channel domain-containing protein [Sediminicoccus rosea]UPY38205.1 mechanosensitive ion channel family protein [Sediminicoccus rosea]
MRVPGLRRILSAIGLLLMLPLAAAAAEGPWAGAWTTSWRDDGDQLTLEQQGERVTGSYPLYGGRIEAVAEGRTLRGTWTEGTQRGQFIFVMDRDGNSFSGRYDEGEWWTGARHDGSPMTTGLNLTTPRDAFRQFIVSGNLARGGRPDAWALNIMALDFSTDGQSLARPDHLRLAQELYALADLTTFRISTIPRETDANEVTITLAQSGSEAVLPLTLTRGADQLWRIRMPTAEARAAARHQLLAQLGGRLPAADAFRQMRNPRDTMRSFLEGMADWDGTGQALALSTLDLSAIPEVLRDGQGRLIAHFLRRALHQIGLVGLQSIPNDGTDRSPYVHFSHPAGRIVIAPLGPEADAPWRFTTQTIREAAQVFAAVEGLPPPIAAPPGLIPDSPYFRVRDWVKRQAPGLLNRLGHTEYWQILAGLLVLSGAALIGTIGARLARRGMDALVGGAESGASFTWALGIVIGLSLAGAFPGMIGMPEEVRRFSLPFFGICLTVAVCVVLWRILGVAGIILARISTRSATAADDILFTLMLATARLGVVTMSFLSLAHFLSLPTGGILAGLGIGGLAFAFASRETLSNVFGAGILVTDRPFQRGDWIASGEIEGAVEHVGIRSTRVRTAQDSVMVIPNGKLSDSTINNLGSRRLRLLKTTLPVTAGASPEALEGFTQALRQRIAEDGAFVAERTDIGLSGITEAGIGVDVITYMKVSTTAAERAVRHAFLLDAVHLAGACGLTLGSGMLPPGTVPPMG